MLKNLEEEIAMISLGNRGSTVSSVSAVLELQPGDGIVVWHDEGTVHGEDTSGFMGYLMYTIP